MTLTNTQLHNIIDLAKSQKLPWVLEVDPATENRVPYAWIWNSVQGDRNIVTSGPWSNDQRKTGYELIVLSCNSVEEMAKEILRLRQELGDLVVE